MLARALPEIETALPEIETNECDRGGSNDESILADGRGTLLEIRVDWVWFQHLSATLTHGIMIIHRDTVVIGIKYAKMQCIFSVYM